MAVFLGVRQQVDVPRRWFLRVPRTSFVPRPVFQLVSCGRFGFFVGSPKKTTKNISKTQKKIKKANKENENNRQKGNKTTQTPERARENQKQPSTTQANHEKTNTIP